MNNKLKPALIGGVVLGILSVIPFVNFANACCCLWAILGGLLATHLYVKSSPTPVNAGDGAIVGALAGLIGGVIAFVLGVPIDIAMGPTMRNLMVDLVANMDSQQAEMLRRQIHIDLLTDQTSAHDALNGYVPNGLRLEEARELRRDKPEE